MLFLRRAGRQSRAFLILSALLLFSALAYLYAGELVWRFVFLPKASQNADAGLSGEVMDSQGQRRDRKLLSLADFALNPEQTRLRAWAVWDVPLSGTYEFYLACDDYGRLQLDYNWLIQQRPAVSARQVQQRYTWLEQGPHLLFLELNNLGGRGGLELLVKGPDQDDFAPFALEGLNSLANLSNFSTWWTLLERGRWLAALSFALSLLGLLLLMHRAGRPRPAPLGAPSDPTRAWIMLAWLLGGALIFCRYIAADMAYDPAMTGRTGFAVLKGMWPVFHADQGYPGCLDAYLAAPLYALFGPTSLIVNFYPALFYLGMVLFMANLLRRLFNPQGYAVGLTVMLIPPAMALYFMGEARVQYSICLFLGAWLMYLCFKLQGREAWGRLSPWLLGLLSAFMVWMHNGAITVVLACVIYLAAQNWRQVIKTSPWFLLGCALGLTPVLLYYLQFGPPPVMHWDVPWADRFYALATRYGPQLLGLDFGFAFADSLPGPTLLAYAGLAVLALGGLYYLIRSQSCRSFVLLPLLIMGLTLISTLLSGRPPHKVLDGRYHLLMLLGLPFCWAALGQQLSSFKLAAPALALMLAASNFIGYTWFWNHNNYDPLRYLTGRSGPDMLNIQNSFYVTKEPDYLRQAKAINELGLTHAHITDINLAFYLGSGTLAAIPYDLYKLAHLYVDASVRPGLSQDIAPASLLWLGLPQEPLGQGLLRLHEPAWQPAEIDLAQARFSDLAGQALAASLIDRNLSTGLAWRPELGAEPQGFVLELKEPVQAGNVSFWAYRADALPTMLRLEGAGADGQFRVLREGAISQPFYLSGPNPMHWGRFSRLETYFEPQMIKYLRLTIPDGSWSLREIRLLGPADSREEPTGWEETKELILKAVDEHKPGFIYADAWPGAVIRTGRRFYGTKITEAEAHRIETPFIKSYNFPHWFMPQPGQALLLAKADAPAAAARLSEEGIAFSLQEAGRFQWLQLNSGQTGPELALKNAGQDPEGVFKIDLAHKAEIQWLNLGIAELEPFRDWPAEIELALDGRTVRAYLAGPLGFTGQMVLPAPYHQGLYRLAEPLAAEAIRLAWPQGELNAAFAPQAPLTWQATVFAPRLKTVGP